MAKPIDISAGLEPTGGGIDLSAGMEPVQSAPSGAAHAIGEDIGPAAKGLAFSLLGGAPYMAYQSIKKGLTDFQSVKDTGKTTGQIHNDEQKDAGYGAVYRHLTTPLAENVGVNVRGMEDAASKGDEAGVLGHTVVPAAMATAPLIAEGATRAAMSPTGGKVFSSGKVIGKAADVTLSDLPLVKSAYKGAKALGGLRDVWFPDKPKPVFPDSQQTAEVPFELRQASPLKHLPETGAKPAAVTGEALGIRKEPAPVYPHQPQGPPKPAPELLQANSLLRGPQPAPPSLADALGKLPLPKNFELPEAKPVFSTTKLGPETPPRELLQANSLTRGPQPAPQLPGAALGGLPVPKLKSFELPQPGPMPKAVASKTLQSTLNAALDAKPTVREGVPMREQMNPEAKPVVSGVPEDHTPVESSAVKSFKYDSQAKELHVATPDGTTYVYGDAEPSAAQNLRDAQSKGKAWKTIRDDHPLVAKIVNGKRIAMKPSIRSATPGPGDGPLLDALKESLKQAQAARAQR